MRDRLLGLASHDIDLAVDNMSGIAFAELLIDHLAKSGIAVSGVGKIKSNPSQSKHLETATFFALGLSLDAVSLRSETYADSSRIPVIVRLFLVSEIIACS